MTRRRLHFFPSLGLSILFFLPVIITAIITILWSFSLYSAVLMLRNALPTDQLLVGFLKTALSNVISNPTPYLIWAAASLICALFVFLFSGADTDDVDSFLNYMYKILFEGGKRYIGVSLFVFFIPGLPIFFLDSLVDLPLIKSLSDFIQNFPYVYLFIVLGIISPIITAIRTHNDLHVWREVKAHREQRERIEARAHAYAVQNQSNDYYYDEDDDEDEGETDEAEYTESSFGSSSVMFSGGGGRFITDMKGNTFIRHSDGSLFNTETNEYMPKTSDGRIHDLATGHSWKPRENGYYSSTSGKVTKVFGSDDDD